MPVVDARSADEWELVTSDAFVPLTCVALRPGFHGRIEFERFDDTLMVSHVETDGLAVDRTERLASRANSDDIHLTFTLGGPGIIRQDGHGTRVVAGSVSTYATDRAYRLDYTAPGQRQILVQVSKRALGIPVAAVEESCSRLLVDAPEAAAALLASLGETRGLGDEGTAETVRDLAGTMIRSSLQGARVMPATRGGMLATVRSFLHGRLHDPTLDVAGIAAAHYISRRHLYELFEPFEETPGDHLRRLRLARAAVLLRDGGGVPIARVAESVGFGDATTFTRAFHREYGMLPSEYRMVS